MRRALLLAALALVASVLAARLLGSRADPRGSALTLEQLVPRELLAGRTVAALSIELPGSGPSWLHVRSKGRWRSREAFGASSDGEALDALLQELLEARGLARAAGAADTARFAAPGTVRIALHGPRVLDAPERDTLVALEFAPLVQGRALARRAGEQRLLDLDRDLVARLGRLDDERLPPLSDAHFIAASLEPGVLGLTRMTIAHRGRETLILERTPPAAGASEAAWVLTEGATRAACPTWRAGGFMGLLLRGTGRGFAAPTRAAELGLTEPCATLTLEAERGAPVEFALSEPRPGGEAWLWNRTTNVILSLDAATQALLAPDAPQFLDTSRPNPWERWLANFGPGERR